MIHNSQPLPYIPQRVVSLQPSATVTLRDLGLLDHLVACTKWCADVCPEVTNTCAIISDSWTADSAQIQAARADLVIASVPYRLEAVVQILKSGTRFLGLAPHCLSDIYADIAAIARVMGAENKGIAVIQNIKAEMDRVREIAGANRGNKSTAIPRVFCEEWGKPIIHSQQWVAELVEVAGGEFLGAPGTKTDADTVRRMDPDVIVVAWCGAGNRAPLEKLVAQRNWQGIRAVREQKVYGVPDEFLNTPASTLLAGLQALAAALHPELFPIPPRVVRIFPVENLAGADQGARLVSKS